MKTTEEMRSHIIDKALNDPEFREKLLDNPNSAISEELGISIPDLLSICVHEESNSEAHLVLPPSSHLKEDDLGKVSSGSAEWANNWREFNHIDW